MEEKIMNIIDGGTYKCENGAIVTVKQISESLYYKFKAASISCVDDNIKEGGMQENWTINGVAYHYDCDWSFINEA
jgi:hypothetical protein